MKTTQKRSFQFMAFLLIFLFCVQGLHATHAIGESTKTLYTPHLMPAGFDRDAQFEGVEVIVAVPNQVDYNDPIQVQIAAIRDARAKYVDAASIRVQLFHVEGDDRFVIAEKYGRLGIGGNWLPDTNHPVKQMDGHPHIYTCEFQPLGFQTTVHIEVTYDWLTPWGDILRARQGKSVFAGAWRNIDERLETEASEVQGDLDAFAEERGEFTRLATNFKDDLTSFSNSFNQLYALESLNWDPSDLHFYLLNITTIVDQREGSESYLDLLRTENPDEFNRIVNIIEETNEAFLESLEYLDRKGLPYEITHVNYTYQDTRYEMSLDYTLEFYETEFYNRSHRFDTDEEWGRNAPMDSNWNDENLNSTSFEWLLEERYWSGHPELVRYDRKINITNLAHNTQHNIKSAPSDEYRKPYPFGMKVNQTGFRFINVEPIYFDSEYAVQPLMYTDDLEIYNGYCYGIAYNNGEKVKTFDITVSSDNSHFEFSTDISSYDSVEMVIEMPGGWVRPDRAFIINLMGPLFPMLTRMYYSPKTLGTEHLRNVRYPEGFEANSSTILFYDELLEAGYEEGDNFHPMFHPDFSELTDERLQFYLDAEDPLYIPPPTMRCHFITEEGLEGDQFIIDETGAFLNLIGPNLVPELGETEEEFESRRKEEGYWEETRWQPDYMTFNIYDYIDRLISLFQKAPFYINSISKPFESFVFTQNLTDGDRYDLRFTEYNATQMINHQFSALIRNKTVNGVTTEVQFELDPAIINIELFQLIDAYSHISTGREGGSIRTSQTSQYDYFYRNHAGFWIETFFNGTMNLGVPLDGSGSNFYMNGHPDGYTFRNPNNEIIDDQPLIPEYSVSPFLGSEDYVPVGAMISGEVTLIQNSAGNLTQGFGYAYGIAMLIYRQIYHKTQNLIVQMIERNDKKINEISQLDEPTEAQLEEREKRHESNDQLKREKGNLYDAWDYKDFNLFDQINQRVLDYVANPENQYTATQNISWIDQQSIDALNTLDEMGALLVSMERRGKQIDQETADLPDDLQSLGLIADISTFLNVTLRDRVETMRNETGTMIVRLYNQFNSNIDKVQSHINYMLVNASKGFESAGEYIGRMVNRTTGNITKFKGDIVNRTSEGINRIVNGINNAINVVIGGTMAIMGTLTAALGAYFMANAAVNVFNPGAVAINVVAAKVIYGLGVAGAMGGAYLIFFDGIPFVSKSDFDIITRIADGLHTTLDGIGQSLNRGVNGIIDTVSNGMNMALESVGTMVNSTANAARTALRVVSQAIGQISNSIYEVYISILDTVLLLLSTVQHVLQKVQNIVLHVINVIQSRIEDVINTVVNLGEALIRQIGQSLQVVGNLLDTINFDQLKKNLEDLWNSNAFIQVRHTIGAAYEWMVERTGLLNYAHQYGEDSEELLLRATDVMTSASDVVAADQGYYIIQMGHVFTNRLYFSFMTPFGLQDPDNATATIKKYAQIGEFGVHEHNETNEENLIVETSLPLIKAVDNDGNEIDGLYYIELYHGRELDWFKETGEGEGIPDFEDQPATEGMYVTVIDAMYNDTRFMSAENTHLLHERYTNEAFPVIRLRDIDPNEEIIIEAGGAPVELTVGVENLMWSQPFVTLEFMLSTETGIPITNMRFPEFQLNNEDGGERLQTFGWRIPSTTPAGEYNLLITILQRSGDFTTVIVPVTVIQTNPIIRILGAGEFWLGMAIAAGLLAGIYYYFNVAKKPQLDRFDPTHLKFEM